jgi:hypothetical protein
MDLPWNYKVCMNCHKLVKINKSFLGSLHMCIDFSGKSGEARLMEQLNNVDEGIKRLKRELQDAEHVLTDIASCKSYYQGDVVWRAREYFSRNNKPYVKKEK